METPAAPITDIQRTSYAAMLYCFEQELAITVASIDPIDRFSIKAKSIANARDAMRRLAQAMTVAFTVPDLSTPHLLAEAANHLGVALVEIRR